MDHTGEHVQDVFTTLYKYHLDNFLCDLVIATPSGSEVHAHSIVLSAMSSKLHDAFDKTQCLTGKDFFYRLRVTESDVGIIETVLQYAYTGNIVLPHDTSLDVMRVLMCSQELGFDANKVAGCMAAMLALTDASVVENIPPVVLTDEEICLEVVERSDS